jgi:hypothetical protein
MAERVLVLGHSRLVESLLGIVAFGIGALNVKDFAAFRHGPSLSIPEAAKPGIYARVRRIVYAERLFPALAGAGEVDDHRVAEDALKAEGDDVDEDQGSRDGRHDASRFTRARSACQATPRVVLHALIHDL